MVMVPAAGVEPATFRSGGERSNPLSYAGVSWEKKIAHRLKRLPVSSQCKRGANVCPPGRLRRRLSVKLRSGSEAGAILLTHYTFESPQRGSNLHDPSLTITSVGANDLDQSLACKF